MDQSPLEPVKRKGGKVVKIPYAKPEDELYERVFLAAALREPDGLLDSGIAEDDFTDPRTRTLYRGMVALVSAAKPFNLLALARWVEANGTPDAVAYVDAVADHPAMLGLDYYATELRELRARRELIGFSEKAKQMGLLEDVKVPVMKRVEALEGDLWRIGGLIDRQRSREAVDAAILTERFIRHYEGVESGAVPAGISTGFERIDRVIGGLKPSKLYVLAARPAMGKSALAANIAMSTAFAGLPSYFLSLEMTEEEIMGRMIAARARISARDLENGRLEGNDRRRMLEAATEIRTIPLTVETGANVSVAQIAARARRLFRERGAGLIVVDYLQLAKAEIAARKDYNRVEEVSEITRGLKNLATELRTPVLALSQLSRAVENRDDKRPQLSDLRESGSIEQDADVVMFLYREEYYHAQREPRKGGTSEKEQAERAAWEARMTMIRNKAELIVAKQRGGPTDTVELIFNRFCQEFVDTAPPGKAVSLPF